MRHLPSCAGPQARCDGTTCHCLCHCCMLPAGHGGNCRAASSLPVRESVSAVVLQLGELMEGSNLARLTFPDGSCVTGLVVELNVPAERNEYVPPSVVLHVYSGMGLNRRVDRVVIELREDALPTVEAATDVFGPPRPLRVSDAVAPPPVVAAATVDAAPLAARKNAENRIEIVFANLTADEDLALLYRLLRRRGWSDDRSDTVLAKARW